MADNSLSIIIPARSEMFLSRTVDDLLRNIRGEKTDIFVMLDGAPADPPVPEHPKVTTIYHPESIGQRAITNEAARLSKAKYIVKCDGHCAFDEGFDVKMMEVMQDDWTMVPVMRNLHAFDWVCKKCGDRRYQGPTPTSCPKCDNTTEFEKDMKWFAKTNPQSTSYCFDWEPHFQYFRDFKGRKKGDLTETMSLQGSFFMLTREKYHELNVCDEAFGSWGSQGLEVAIKTWLSGGSVMVNHKTWYAHMFRTQGGDFGFPYKLSGRQVDRAKKYARDLFFNNKWPKQKYPLSWLVEKFWPVNGWTQAQLDDLKKNDCKLVTTSPVVASTPVDPTPVKIDNVTKGIVYYTDNRLDEGLASKVRSKLLEMGLPIVSVSLKPIEGFGKNIVKSIVLDKERSYLTMFEQQLAGIEAMDTDVIFLCEHDVLYSKEHFEFTPPRKDIFFYNKSNWQVRQTDGHAVYWDCKKVSQICGYRDLMLAHYKERVRKTKEVGFTRRMGFEPGTHGRAERVDDTKSEFFSTKIPNLDIRHRKNLTASRWNAAEFRNPCRNWTESHVSALPGWENLILI